MTLRLVIAALLVFVLEVSVTIATAHQHHSEARWEISAAYFGTVIGYLLGRLVIWLPFAFALVVVAKLRFRQLAIGKLAVAAIVLEVATTLGSVLFREERPPYGIFFGTFARYLGARLVLWIPLACLVLLPLIKRSRLRIPV